MDLLRMTGVRESSEDRRIEPVRDGEILTNFMHGWHLGISGIAELPREHREGCDRPHAVAQADISLKAGATQLVEVMGFLKGVYRGRSEKLSKISPPLEGEKRGQATFLAEIGWDVVSQ